MIAELALKFLLGGAIVTVFSALGEIFQPKHFAGIFGAAPSVALASLSLAYAAEGSAFVAVEGRSMAIGAVAFYVYGAACVAAIEHERVPVWFSAASAWGAWFACAFAMWGIGHAAGVLK